MVQCADAVALKKVCGLGPQAEVLVCAKGGGGLLRERMALAARLWEAGIRAELVHSASPSQTAQYEYAGARAIPWLVTINAATFSTTDTVRVRSLPSPCGYSLLTLKILSTEHQCRLVLVSDGVCSLDNLLLTWEGNFSWPSASVDSKEACDAKGELEFPPQCTNVWQISTRQQLSAVCAGCRGIMASTLLLGCSLTKWTNDQYWWE